MGKREYLAALAEAVEHLRVTGRSVTLIHHNDADGLSSAATLHTSLSRAGFEAKLIPLERVHPPIVERIHAISSDQVVIYADLGGRAAPVISELNRGQCFTLILDHHPAEASIAPEVVNLSTELFGISGEKEISAATAAYLFALTLDSDNRDLAYLGVIGAIGDSHDRDGRLIGENREAMREAVSRGEVRIKVEDGRETYTLTRFGEELPLRPFAKSLTTLGAAGYALGGPELGMRACLSGPSSEYEVKLRELNFLKRERFEKELARLKVGGLRRTRHIQWFSVGKGFSPMGVKILGEFCMDIRDMEFMGTDKYIAGFQDMPSEVPSLGEFDWDLVKVSMRVPAPLEERIVTGKMPGLAWLLPEAARKLGGSIDACHDYAAASLIPRGREEELVGLMDELLNEKLA